MNASEIFTSCWMPANGHDQLLSDLNCQFNWEFELWDNPKEDALMIDWMLGPGVQEVLAFIRKHFPTRDYGDYMPKPSLFGIGKLPTTFMYKRRDLSEGNPVRVQKMLDMGADPNQPDAWGVLPLTRAITFRNREVIDLLLQAGADPDKLDNDCTPLELAGQWWEEVVGQLIAGSVLRTLDQAIPQISSKGSTAARI